VNEPSALYRLLGDDARLRLLRLLSLERLNVTELTGILGIAQSGVSRHLGLLKEGGLVHEEREAGYTYYRVDPSVREGSNGFRPLWGLLDSQFDAMARTDAGRGDNARLEEVRRLRQENFDAHAGPDAKERQLVPGRSWAAWARALAPAPAGARRGSRVRRRVSDDRGQPFRLTGDRDRPLVRSLEARA